MNKLQFWILNATSLLLVTLLLGHFFTVQQNDRLKLQVVRNQATIENNRQSEIVLDQLAKRIARGSDIDPRLTNILVKHSLAVTLEVDGKKKNYP